MPVEGAGIMRVYGHNLETIVGNVDRVHQIPKASLNPGDLIMVTTHNSVYRLLKRESNLFEVSGGWFDRQNLSPFIVNVVGCTWGGSIIKVDIVAACGLCLEFGNRLITSPILKIAHIKFKNLN